MSKFKIDKLENLCHRIGDGLHGTPLYLENSTSYFINGNNLVDGRIRIDKEIKKVSDEEVLKQNLKLNENSLLMSINGTIGNIAFYRNEKIMLGKSAAYMNFKTNINQFYYYYFQLKGVQKNFYDIATGSTIKNLSLKSIQNFKVPVPEAKEWQGIFKTLSDLDSKIELNNKINAELESMAKLLYDYWFVQFDFPDANGKPYKSSGGKMVYNEELRRVIPEGWVFGSFADIIDSLESGNRPKGGIENTNIGVPSIGAENILSIGKYNYSHEKLIPKKFFDKMTQGVVIDNDVLMYKDGASLGRVTMFKRGFPYKECSINSHAFILRTNNKISQNYLYFWLDQSFIKDIIKRLGMKAAQPGINQSNVKSLPILIPNNDIINKFENLINPSIDSIFENAKQNRQLSLIRDFLLPMLMNGQVRVR